MMKQGIKRMIYDIGELLRELCVSVVILEELCLYKS